MRLSRGSPRGAMVSVVCPPPWTPFRRAPPGARVLWSPDVARTLQMGTQAAHTVARGQAEERKGRGRGPGPVLTAEAGGSRWGGRLPPGVRRPYRPAPSLGTRWPYGRVRTVRQPGCLGNPPEDFSADRQGPCHTHAGRARQTGLACCLARCPAWTPALRGAHHGHRTRALAVLSLGTRSVPCTAAGDPGATTALAEHTDH